MKTKTMGTNGTGEKNDSISNDGSRKHRSNDSDDWQSHNNSGFPPAHAIATIAVLSGMALWWFPSMEMVDQIATVETLSHPLFPQYVAPAQLGMIRWAFSGLVFGTGGILIFGPSAIRHTDYLATSKLKNRMIRTSGFKTAYSFTSWCWYLLGVHFAASGAIPLWHHYMNTNPVPVWLPRLAVLSFHLAAPAATLVSCLVRYALWPNALRHGKSTDVYKAFPALITHNANVGMVLAETALLGGGVPIALHLLSLPTLLGCSYTVFTWLIRFQWATSPTGKREPHFIYFFFDTTLPGLTASMVILALWLTSLVFYLLFYVMSHTLFVATASDLMGVQKEPPALAYNVAVMTVVLSLLCRFRD